MNGRLSGHERVLARTPSWLGDLVMAEPAIRALVDRVERGGGTVALAGPGRLLALLDGRFPAAERLPHDGRERAIAWRGRDVAVLLNGTWRSAWTALCAGIPRRVGWSRDGRGWLLTDGARPSLERGRRPAGIGRVGHGRRFLPRPFGASCAELLGLLGVEVRDARPRLFARPFALERVRARLGEAGIGAGEPFVLVGAGGRPGSAKALPPSTWSATLERLAESLPHRIVLVAGPGEESALERVAAGCRRAAPERVAAPDLHDLVALTSLAELLLTADSGPRHVATALGTPVVCAYGPTDPRHTADHTGDLRGVRVEVPCGPCHLERCPLSGADEHACMRGLDPERLARAAVELLRGRAPRAARA